MTSVNPDDPERRALIGLASVHAEPTSEPASVRWPASERHIPDGVVAR